jgi:excisionase family DNA binding protein
MRNESRRKATATRKRNSVQKLAELPTRQELRSMRSLLSVRQVATIMSICPTTVRRFSASATLPHIRIGNRIRFDPAAVADFLEGLVSRV